MKRIVFKVGSSVLTDVDNIAKERMLNLVSLIVQARKKYEVILVTSGAVAAGYTALKLDRKKEVSKLKAAEYLMKRNREMFLCSGFDLQSAKEFLFEDGYDKGTLFSSNPSSAKTDAS